MFLPGLKEWSNCIGRYLCNKLLIASDFTTVISDHITKMCMYTLVSGTKCHQNKVIIYMSTQSMLSQVDECFVFIWACMSFSLNYSGMQHYKCLTTLCDYGLTPLGNDHLSSFCLNKVVKTPGRLFFSSFSPWVKCLPAMGYVILHLSCWNVIFNVLV